MIPFVAGFILRAQFREALLLFVATAATDALDGWLARRFGWITRFGAVADPIADKLLLTVIYVCLGAQGAMPAWLVGLVVGRDALILLMAGAALAFTRLRDFPPSRWGKVSTFLQIVAAIAVMAQRSGWIGSEPVGPAIAAAAAVTVVSGFHYVITGVSRTRSAAG